MSNNLAEKLQMFTREVDMQLAFGAWADKDLPIVGNDGMHKVVVALAEEKLYNLFKRVENVGGNANIFIDMGSHITRLSSVASESALGADNAEDMTGSERPSLDATVGMFVDYLSSQADGVILPPLSGYRPATSQEVKIEERQLAHA